MQFDANLAPARANPLPGPSGSLGGEIDLYEELLAFAEMSPEEQRLYFAEAKSESEPTQATRPSIPELVAPEPIESLDPEPMESCELEPIEVKDAEIVSTPAELAIAHSDSTPLDEEVEVNEPAVELSDGSDPLVDLNLDGGFSDVLPGKDCLACGAESGADDLFCMSCGSFLNGVASNSPSNPLCADCNQGITIDEIFCPWCGSVLAGS
jgi:double zinc ribbon protein